MRKPVRFQAEVLEDRRLFAIIGLLTDPAYVDWSDTVGAIPTGPQAMENWFKYGGANTVIRISDATTLNSYVNGDVSFQQVDVLAIPSLSNGSLVGVFNSTQINDFLAAMAKGTAHPIPDSSTTDPHLGMIFGGDPAGSTNNTDFIETLLAGKIGNLPHNQPTSTTTTFQRAQAIGTKLAGLTSPAILSVLPVAQSLDLNSLPTGARSFFQGSGNNTGGGNAASSVVGFRYADVMPIMYLGWTFTDGGGHFDDNGAGGTADGHVGDRDWKDILRASVAAVTDTAVVYDDPSTPSNLVASAGTGSTQIQLQWSDNSGLFGTPNETGFAILQAQDDGFGNPGPFATRLTPDAPANATSYTVTGLTPGIKYFFEVAAIRGGAFTSFSNIASATTNNGTGLAPLPPTDLAGVSNSGSTVTLTWTDNSSDELGFRILRSQSPGGFLSVGTVGANVTTFTDTGLIDGTLYSYKVEAYNASGKSAQDGPVDVLTAGVNPGVPLSPTTLTGSNGTPTTVDLTWTDLATNETAYQVEQATAIDGPFSVIATLPADSTTYSVTGLSTGTVYYFRVRALNGNYASEYSVILPWTAGDVVGSGVPLPPTEAGITLISPTELTVFWKDNASNETGYTIERASSVDGPWVTAGSVAADVASLYFSDLTPSTTYFYRVRATNSVGIDAYSNVATATTAATPPPVIVQSAPPADIIVESSIIGELPLAVVSGSTGKVTVGIINNGAGTAKAIVTFKLVASLDTVDDSSDIVLATVSKTLNLKPGRLNKVKVKFTYPLSTPAGTYRLIADPVSVTPLVGSGSAPTVSVKYAPSTTLSIAPPFINLGLDTLDPTSPAFDAGGTGTAQLTIRNTGNVTFSGSPTIVLTTTGGSVTDLTLATAIKKFNLKSGQAKKFKIKFIVPFNFGGGIYRLTATVTPPAGTVDSDSSDNTTVSLGQFGVGVPSGNVTPPAANTFVLGTGWASSSSTSLSYTSSDAAVAHPAYLATPVGKSDYTVAARINFGTTAATSSTIAFFARSIDTNLDWNQTQNYNVLMAVGAGVSITRANSGSFPSLTPFIGGTALVANTDYDASFTVAGTQLSARIRRVSDGLYLQPDGSWGSAGVDCASVSDSTLSSGGYAGVSGYSTDGVTRTVTNLSVN